MPLKSDGLVPKVNGGEEVPAEVAEEEPAAGDVEEREAGDVARLVAAEEGDACCSDMVVS